MYEYASGSIFSGLTGRRNKRFFRPLSVQSQIEMCVGELQNTPFKMVADTASHSGLVQAF